MTVNDDGNLPVPRSAANELILTIRGEIDRAAFLRQELADQRFQLIQEEIDRRFETVLRDQNLTAVTLRDTVSKLEYRIDQKIDSSVSAAASAITDVKERIGDLSRLLDERYATQVKALDAAFVAAEKAVSVALDNAEKAVTKAEIANEKRFESVNEFRAQQSDIIRGFVSRDEYGTAHHALEDKTESAAARNSERIAELNLRLENVAASAVPRTETSAWKEGLSVKIDDGIKALTDRVSALELRLTSRLDTGQGERDGAQSVTGTGYGKSVFDQYERIAVRSGQRVVTSQVIAAVSVFIALAGVITAIVLAFRK